MDHSICRHCVKLNKFRRQINTAHELANPTTYLRTKYVDTRVHSGHTPPNETPFITTSQMDSYVGGRQQKVAGLRIRDDVKKTCNLPLSQEERADNPQGKANIAKATFSTLKGASKELTKTVSRAAAYLYQIRYQEVIGQDHFSTVLSSKLSKKVEKTVSKDVRHVFSHIQ